MNMRYSESWRHVLTLWRPDQDWQSWLRGAGPGPPTSEGHVAALNVGPGQDGGMADSTSSLCPAHSPGTLDLPSHSCVYQENAHMYLNLYIHIKSFLLNLYSRSWPLGPEWLACLSCDSGVVCRVKSQPSLLSLIRSAEFWLGRQHSLPILSHYPTYLSQHKLFGPYLLSICQGQETTVATFRHWEPPFVSW